MKIYSCVEKSCQTFAKRFTRTLIGNNNEITAKIIIDRLEKELKLFHTVIYSYSKDIRFKNVNFKLCHSRFATLVIAHLKKEDIGCDGSLLNQIRESLKEINISCTKDYILCLCWRLQTSLGSIDLIDHPDSLFTEKECEEAWNNESQCSCNLLVDAQSNFRRNDKKNYSYRRNRRVQSIKITQEQPLPSKDIAQEFRKTDLWAMRDQPRDYEDDDEDDIYFVSLL